MKPKIAIVTSFFGVFSHTVTDLTDHYRPYGPLNTSELNNYLPLPIIRTIYAFRIRVVTVLINYLLILPYKYIIIINNKLLSHIWYPYMDTKVNINALRCNNCNIEKVDIGELLKVVNTD